MTPASGKAPAFPPSADRPDSFRAIYEEHAPFIRRLLFRTCGEQLLEDAVQETFLKAFLNLSGFRGECSLKSWLARIGLNVARDLLRRKKRLSWLKLGESNDEPTPSPAVSPEADDWIERQRLQRCLDRLTPKLRQTLVLFSIEELALKEIAEILEVPQGTVKSRLNEARRLVKQYLEKL